MGSEPGLQPRHAGAPSSLSARSCNTCPSPSVCELPLVETAGAPDCTSTWHRGQRACWLSLEEAACVNSPGPPVSLVTTQHAVIWMCHILFTSSSADGCWTVSRLSWLQASLPRGALLLCWGSMVVHTARTVIQCGAHTPAPDWTRTASQLPLSSRTQRALSLQSQGSGTRHFGNVSHGNPVVPAPLLESGVRLLQPTAFFLERQNHVMERG